MSLHSPRGDGVPRFEKLQPVKLAPLVTDEVAPYVYGGYASNTFPQAPQATNWSCGPGGEWASGELHVLTTVHTHLAIILDIVAKELRQRSVDMDERLSSDRQLLALAQHPPWGTPGFGPRTAEKSLNVTGNALETAPREWTPWSDYSGDAVDERGGIPTTVGTTGPKKLSPTDSKSQSQASSTFAARNSTEGSFSGTIAIPGMYRDSHVRDQTSGYKHAQVKSPSRFGSIKSMERMSSLSSSPTSSARLKEHFDRCDTLEKGRLTARDTLDLMLQHLGQAPDLSYVEEMIKFLNLASSLFKGNMQGPALECAGSSGLIPEETDYLANDADFDSETAIGIDAYHFLMCAYEPGAEDSVDLSLLRLAFRKEIQANFAESNKHAIGEHLEQAKEEEGPRGLLGLMLDVVPAFVIMTNALIMGLEADLKGEEPTDGSFVFTIWNALELGFFVFFAAEFIMKIKIFNLRTVFFGQDRLWNWFDVFCIATGFADLCITYGGLIMGGGGFNLNIQWIKILRLARLGRMVRLLRFKIFHELKMMVQGVVSGMRVLCWAIVLLLGCVFFLAVVFRTLMGNQPEFSTVNRAMFSLFRCFTDGCVAYNGTPLQERLREDVGLHAMYSYILIYLFVTIGIFNLIMAIFIDNVVTAHIQRKQHELGENAAKMEVRINEVIAKRFEACRQVHKAQQKESSKRLLSTARRETEGNYLANVSDRLSYMTKDGKSKDWQRRREEAQEIISEIDEEIVITKDVFNTWLNDPDMLILLEEVEVETSTKYELFDALDVDSGGELTVEELVSGLMKLRGPVSKNDIVATRLKVGYMTELVEDVCRHHGIQLSCDGPTAAADLDGRVTQKITIDHKAMRGSAA